MRVYVFYALAVVLLLAPFLGNVHLFDWDEINFAEASREMVVTGNYSSISINYLPFWEKPPLFFWMQAAGYHLFGVGEFAARFPNILCALATVITFLFVGKKLHGERFGRWWVLVYLGSVLPQFYFRSGLIDPWFNLFIFWGLLGVIFHAQQRRQDGHGMYPMFWGGLALGLAVLTKGPAAILLVGLAGAGYWALNRFRFYWCWQGLLLFGATTIAVPALWFGLDYIQNGPWLWEQFTTYQIRLAQTQDAGHGGFPGYHVVVLLFGCFPASFLFVQSFFVKKQRPLTYSSPSPQEGEKGAGDEEVHPSADFSRWMQCLFWVVLILFSIVQSKIVHYSSMCYPPLTYGATFFLMRVLDGKANVAGWVKGFWIFVGTLLGMACLLFPFLGNLTETIRPLFSADKFAEANLGALPEIHWTGLEAFVGLWSIGVPLVAIALINRKRLEQGFYVLFGGTALTVMWVLWAFMGRIEYFTQGAAIEFLESLQGKKVYIVPMGYRTYTTFFYARLQPDQAPGLAYQEELALIPNRWRDSILTQPVDRPLYVISKITSGDPARYPLLKEIGRKNGFVFWQKSEKQLKREN